MLRQRTAFSLSGCFFKIFKYNRFHYDMEMHARWNLKQSKKLCKTKNDRKRLLKGELIIETLKNRLVGFFYRPGDILNVSSIRRETLPFFFGWVIIFTWLYCYLLPNGSLLFLDSAALTGYERTGTYIWLIVCPLITAFSTGARYVPKTMYSVMLALGCLIGLLFFDTGRITLALQVAIAACAGHIFASCVFSFFMILNNAEKFYSMALGILLPKLLVLFGPLISKRLRIIEYSEFISLSCLLLLLVCSSSFYKEKSIIPYVGKAPFPQKAWSLMAMVFIVLAFQDVIAPLTLISIKAASGQAIEFWYFGGIVAGLLLVLLLQKRLKVNIGLMLNLSMAMFAVGFALNMAVKDYGEAIALTSISFGAAYSIGMVNIYYLAGLMAKKFRNITFFRVGIMLSSVYYFYGFGTVHALGNVLSIISIVSICVVILFLLLSPLFLRLLYDGEWLDDSYRQDVTFESRLQAKLKELKLSPKETEVCELLLRGYTLRQTAAMMGIAYPTANTYCTALYRKLNINSRTELTLLFKDYIEQYNGTVSI